MTVPTFVGIPYMDRYDMTAPLVASLLTDPAVTQVLLWDNGSTDPRTLRWQERVADGDRVVLRRRPKVGAVLDDGRRWSLHASWNGTWTYGAAYARGGPVNIVLLNNDLSIPDGFVGALVGALRAADDDVWITYPDQHAPLDAPPPDGTVQRTRGLAPSGGMTGWAFALRGELWPGTLPLVDERFVLYCGDTDLLWQTQMRGGLAARVVGLPCIHRLGATRRRIDWKAYTRPDRAWRATKYPAGSQTRLEDVAS